jgi:MFS superfamily sulfate permease-like transporter
MTRSRNRYPAWPTCTTSTTTPRRTVPGLVVHRYDAPLFFANAQDFRRRAQAAAASQDPVRWFVHNVEANVKADFTALEAVEALREEFTRAGIIFALARVKHYLLVRLEAFGLAAKSGPDLLFPTLPTAVAAYQQWASSSPRRRPPVAVGLRHQAPRDRGRAMVVDHQAAAWLLTA